MPAVQERDGLVREYTRAIEDAVQQSADGGQTRWEHRRRVLAREFLEVHDQTVDRQESRVPTRFDESQFLPELRQNLKGPAPAGSRLLGERHVARYHILDGCGKGETLIRSVGLTVQRGSA